MNANLETACRFKNESERFVLNTYENRTLFFIRCFFVAGKKL